MDGPSGWPATASFGTHFPDVEIRLKTADQKLTARIAEENVAIDFLHIDADHTYEQCKHDFFAYRRLMASVHVITIHESTDMRTCSDRVVNELRSLRYRLMEQLIALGRSLAIVADSRDTPKLHAQGE